MGLWSGGMGGHSIVGGRDFDKWEFKYTTIFVVVDQLSKQCIFIPIDNKVTSLELAKLFLLCVFSKHGVPSYITSDWGLECVFHFFCSLEKALDIHLHVTFGYHPKGDGQIEQINQMLEQYLQIYCDYQQDKWSKLLPLVEFSYNNASNVTTCYRIHWPPWYSLYFPLSWWTSACCPCRLSRITRLVSQSFLVCSQCFIPLDRTPSWLLSSSFYFQFSTSWLDQWFPFCSILVLYAFLFRFHSYCATVLQHCSKTLILFHFSFLISHWTALLHSHYL